MLLNASCGLYAQFRVLGVTNIPQNGIEGNFRLEISDEIQARKKKSTYIIL
jgi:hypothetical protein